MGMIDKPKITEKIDELRNFLDVELHPAVSPDKWDIYSTLCDMIDELETVVLELLKKQKPKDFDLVEQSLFAKIGLCPECGEKLHSGMHPNYCGFCGQAVKWE